mgnify:CR=1 FL=1
MLLYISTGQFLMCVCSGGCLGEGAVAERLDERLWEFYDDDDYDYDGDYDY